MRLLPIDEVDRTQDEQIPRGFAGLERLISYEAPAAGLRAPASPLPAPDLSADPVVAPMLDALAVRAPLPSARSRGPFTPLRVSLAALGIAIAVLMISTMISRLAPVTPAPAPVVAAAVAETVEAGEPASPVDALPRTWDEAQPPRGRDIVLTNAELTYCLSEKLRLDTLQSLVDANETAEDAQLKLGMQDYLSRCGIFRSPPGALDTVQAEVDARRPALELEARARLSNWRTRRS